MKNQPTRFTPILLVISCLTVFPAAQAVVPPPDGGYPGGNTAEGAGALLSLTTGTYNTAIGYLSLRSNTEGGFNTGVGSGALLSNNSGRNTATGAAALLSNTTGPANTANGALALLSNTEGGYNTAVGDRALQAHTAGDRNTAIGASALLNDTTGTNNTAIGAAALLNNASGRFNTAIGDDALGANTTGIYNTATGAGALFGNTTGEFNTAVGDGALAFNTVGYSNTATGGNALFRNTTGFGNTANGVGSLYNNTTGPYNTALGISAGHDITGSNNVCIGAFVTGVAGESNTTRIRNVYDSLADHRSVYVNSDNKIGTLSSSRRYKNEIKPMAKASEAILSLRPVSFRYKKEVDRTRSLSFGLIAEEVAQVDPDLVSPDRDGKPEAVRYDAVNAMLLNEFLKEHKTVQALKKEIAALKEGLQKVTAQLEMSKATPNIVLNNP